MAAVHDESDERGRALAEMADALRRLEYRRAATHGVARRPTRREMRRAWLRHWSAPGAGTPWWVFGVKLVFWLLIGAGVHRAHNAWHPDFFIAALGIADLGWRAYKKFRAERAPRPRASGPGIY